MLITLAKRRLMLAAALLGFLSPVAASADTVGPVTVSSVGVQGGQIYIFSPDIPSSCGGIVYLDENSGYAEYVMSIALSAKVGGTRLSRIDFEQGSPCRIDLVAI